MTKSQNLVWVVGGGGVGGGGWVLREREGEKNSLVPDLLTSTRPIRRPKYKLPPAIRLKTDQPKSFQSFSLLFVT